MQLQSKEISSFANNVQAQQYAALRKPYLINDMLMQDILLDRRKVYEQLQVRTIHLLVLEGTVCVLAQSKV